MISAISPENEDKRIAALREYDILNSAPEAEFDELTQLASMICETPIALISLVDGERQWFKSKVGLDAHETPRDIAFCAHAILDVSQPLIVQNAIEDERFHDNPLVVGAPDIRFYAGWPLKASNGEGIGTLCVIDQKPRTLSTLQLEALRVLSRQVMIQLELRKALRQEKMITDRLQRNEERLQLAVSGTTDGLWDWNVLTGEVYYSPRFLALTGHVPSELPNTLESWIDLLHPDDRDHVNASVAAHFKDHTPYSVEYRMRHKDGYYIWCNARGRASWDEQGQPVRMTGFTVDISERKAAALELEKTTERLELILGQIGEGIYGIDTEGRTTFGNHAAAKMLGYSLDEMIGQPQHALIHHHHLDGSDYPQSECPIYQSFSDGQIHKTDKDVFWHKDGTPIPVEYTASPMRNSAGEITGSVVVFRDISERKHVEQQLHDYAMLMEAKTLELARSKEQAEAATRLKSEFLANMSHEIRTPMNGIIGMANLLLDGNLGAAEQGYAQTLVRSAESLLCIINDILDYSKIEATKVDLESIPFDLKQLCQETHQMMSFKAREKRLDFLLEYEEGTPRHVVGDPGRLRQILNNLLNNAIKFTQAGHVKLNISSKVVSDQIVHLNIEVEDTGIGIPEDKLSLIFNKFSQADQSTARKFGGTGLGLAICKELAQMMGGDIGVRSTVGVGSTFWCTVMMDLGEQMAIEASEDKINQNTQGTLNLADVDILLVEDNQINQIVATNMLKKYGCRITLAKNGIEAVQKFNEAEFDIILMDCQMPEMDGYEATTAIRLQEAQEMRLRVPIIAFTAHALKGDDDKCFQSGMDDYMPKPVRKEDLERVLIKWLPHSHTHSNEAAPESKLSSTSGGILLDKDIFDLFLETVGADYADVLDLHRTLVHEHIQEIQKHLDLADFNAVALAAHPLKSSCGQVGAIQVARLAQEIERMCKSDSPDQAVIRALAAQLLQAQLETEAILDGRMGDYAISA